MTPSFDLTFLAAQPADLALVIGILDEAAAWMLQHGIHQWQAPSPPEVWERMAREIDKGDVFLARLASTGELVGTLRFEWAGGPLWPAEANAGYIHTMAVRPAHMGHGIGKHMLTWAIDHIRHRGKRLARLDCMANSPRLRAYYESAGFVFRGVGRSGDYHLALFELPL